MVKENSNWWKSVYNCLFLLTINSQELSDLKMIPFPLFDSLEEELEESKDVGFCGDALLGFLEEKWVTLDQSEEMYNFKKHIDTIESRFWTEYEILNGQEWDIARKWANKLFSDLEFTRNGFDTSGIETIYV